jgi:hypothetical protein
MVQSILISIRSTRNPKSGTFTVQLLIIIGNKLAPQSQYETRVLF